MKIRLKNVVHYMSIYNTKISSCRHTWPEIHVVNLTAKNSNKKGVLTFRKLRYWFTCSSRWLLHHYVFCCVQHGNFAYWKAKERYCTNNNLFGFVWFHGINGPGDLGSIPGRVIPKTLKRALDTSLLNTQHYKVRIKGKVEQSRERSSVLPYNLV